MAQDQLEWSRRCSRRRSILDHFRQHDRHPGVLEGFVVAFEEINHLLRGLGEQEMAGYFLKIIRPFSQVGISCVQWVHWILGLRFGLEFGSFAARWAYRRSVIGCFRFACRTSASAPGAAVDEALAGRR